MYDVLIIGGNNDGLQIAQACLDAGLNVLVVDSSRLKPETWSGGWVEGLGVVSGAGLVAVLDPDTADERRVVQTNVVVISLEELDPAQNSCRMLGISKLGAVVTPDGRHILTDSSGRTRAKGIYATSAIASEQTPGIVDDVIKYCSSTLSNS